MIGYVTVGTRDLERARRFYDDVLGARSASSSYPKSVGNDIMIAFAAGNRDKVRAIYDKALQLGAQSEGAPAAAALQEITPNQLRAQVSALYLFSMNILGIALGPTVVAALTDHVFGRDDALPYSLALTVAGAAPLAIVLLALSCRPYRATLAQYQQEIKRPG
jgi:catechol 2,3-dioxygenase-like lactoylglutathione lyase family enzyme